MQGTMRDLTQHHEPDSISDHIAYSFVKFLRFFADALFAKRYGHRAVVLETVAAVPGMVGGLLVHLKSLRYIRDDQGWIRTLLDEAENERMHLMTFIEIAQPTRFERFVVMVTQAIFYNAYFWLYLFSPKTAHRVTYIHNLFQNGAATLSGLVEMYHELIRRGELADSTDITFIMVTGDGGMDIGMGPSLGAAHRNHHMMILEYDNQGYMNTGAQLSYSTPLGHRTSTSEVGARRKGKVTHHKDTPQIFAAAHLPYVFTASEGYPEDLMLKASKAQWYAKHEGMTYGKILSFCPLNWTTTDDAAESELQVAIDSCFFPIYEVERGKTNITYDPELLGRKRNITDWLGQMGKTKHLMAEGNEQRLAAIEEEAERRWRRIKAMHEHPEL